MDSPIEKFLSSYAFYRGLCITLVLLFAAAFACVAIMGWQTYQMAVAHDQLVQHLLTRLR